MSNGILVVDDNANRRRLLVSFVESHTPFKVCGEAKNGVEAIRKAKKLQPDLVLVDLTMKMPSGTDTATALQLLKPRPKIILFTLHAKGGFVYFAPEFASAVSFCHALVSRSSREKLIPLISPVIR